MNIKFIIKIFLLYIYGIIRFSTKILMKYNFIDVLNTCLNRLSDYNMSLINYNVVTIR